MRTPKHEALIRALVWYNNYINKYKNIDLNSKLKNWESVNLPQSINLIKNLDVFELLSRDTSPLNSNSWLAGITDANGNFSISLYKKKRINLYYRLELKQNYHRPLDISPTINMVGILKLILKMI